MDSCRLLFKLNRVLRAVAQIAVAASVAVATASFGQDADPRGLPVPNHSAVDQNGVDLGSGRLDIGIVGPSIGPADIGLRGDVRYVLEGGVDVWLKYVSFDGIWNAQTQTYQITVHTGERTSVFHQRAGTIFLYTGDGGESYNSGAHTFTARDGTVYAISGPGYANLSFIGSITKPDGEVITLNYAVAGTGIPDVINIVSNTGYAIHRENGVVTAFNRAIDYCDPAAVHCTFSRAWPSRTWTNTTVTDELGRQTQLINRGLLNPSIIYPSGKTISVGIGTGGNSPDASAGRVVSYSDGTSTWNYSWQWNPPCPGNIPTTPACVLSAQPILVTRTDPNNHVLIGKSVFGGLYSKQDELNRTTSYGVETWGTIDLGRTVSIIYPEGNSVTFPFGLRGNTQNVTSTSKDGSQSIAVSATFPATCTNINTCNQPQATFDGRGYETDYTYYDWGGLKSQLGPSVNGVRPLTRYFYTQLYAYVKNASGALVQGESPVWRLTQTIQCMKTISADATACASSADELVTNYEYGGIGDASALLVHGRVVVATGAALRTCYGYNALGDKISETSPRAGLTSCP